MDIIIQEIINKLVRGECNLEEACNQFQEFYIHSVSKESLAVHVTFLDQLFNINMDYGPSFVLYLLANHSNDNLYRSAIVFEQLRGKKIEAIREHPRMIAEDTISKEFSHISIQKPDIFYKYYDLLSHYLKDKGFDMQDLEEFALELDSVQEVMFQRSDCLVSRKKILKELFLLESISSEALNEVYQNVLLKNPVLSSFYYGDMILERPYLLTVVKGLIRKCEPEIVEKVIPLLSNVDLKKIQELNEDDSLGLHFFFNDSFDKDSLLEESYLKLLKGESTVDELLLRELGTYPRFQENLSFFLEQYIKSKDVEYQKGLMIPLMGALLEKQRKYYDLDFSVTFTQKELKNRLGYWDFSNKTIYMNPTFLYNIHDSDMALIQMVNTVFHETRHAYQDKKMRVSEFNIENLLFNMDRFLNENLEHYYEDNYLYLASEMDARRRARKDTNFLLKNYYKIQYDDLDIPISCRENMVDNTVSHGFEVEDFFREVDGEMMDILTLFMRQVEIMKEQGKGDILREWLKRTPVFSLFFDIDWKSLIVIPKSEEYFQEQLEDLRDLSSLIENSKEQIQAIHVFQYMKKIQHYIDLKQGDFFEEEMIEEIGNMPIVR